MLDVKTITLIPRNIEAVKVTEENIREVAEWVQGYHPFQKVAVTDARLYLPSSTNQTDIMEPGDWVFRDPADDSFRGAEDAAVQSYYMEVPDVGGDQAGA